MKQLYPEYHPQFFTATILDWQHLLSKNEYKDTIINSLRFLVDQKRISLFAFVIMSNHIHLIWQALAGHHPEKIQLSFMKFTAQAMKFDLIKNDPLTLANFRVDKSDREYQFWKRKPLSIGLFTPAVFEQKLNYIHYNPVKAGLCKQPEDYHYSSAKFYETGVDDFGMLTDYLG